MLVKIDTEKLKQLREQRCWSQQQLADVSGLSLRTVQRIESKAVASQESVKSLAAVFEIETQVLLFTPHQRPESSEGPDRERREITDNSLQSSKQEAGKVFRKLYISFAAVFASHLIAFFSIFAAFNQNEISEQTFQFLKNTVSVALVVSAVVLLWRDRQLKKKYNDGSSLL